MNASLPQFAIFLSLVLSVYGAGNWYIYRHLASTGISLPVLRISFTALALVFPLAMSVFRNFQNQAVKFFSLIGYYYLGIGLYLILLFGVLDVTFLVARKTGILPASYAGLKIRAVPFILVFSVLLMLIGTWGANRHVVTPLTVKAPPGSAIVKPVTIAFVSDIHLGTITNDFFVRALADSLTALKPDVIIYGGDVIDRSSDEVRGRGYETILGAVRAPLGVYAITGNHEFFGGLDENMDFIRSMNAVTLMDEGVAVGGLFYLVGRLDAVVTRFGGSRKQLTGLLAGNTGKLPVIVADHSPYDLNEPADNGVFLNLSGHTHHGQMFPVSLVTSRIFELSYGYMKKGDSHFFVSSGYGTWGPPIRIGTKSEILLITVEP